jgi:hypothetical protein
MHDVRALPPRLSVGYRTFGSNLLMSAELVPIAAIRRFSQKTFRGVISRDYAELIDRAQLSSDAEEKTWKRKAIA